MSEQTDTEVTDVETGDSEVIDDADTFPAHVVRDLREKNGRYRTRAHDAEQRADTAETRATELAQRLHTALVEQTGRLQDSSDLPFSAEHLDDTEALVAALDALLEAKPHLKSRKVAGNAGFGVQGEESQQVTLESILQQYV
ncbi:hypothetical protein [Mycolicibacterium sphagni]|uniref:Uncharacterized protein n=1 Tax=Mycolicibacterium sphagni TaxID=1786 RepID=A0A255DL38_9MYCO|nr:hypothetical protein [Mycolicibacterium sphagni]OYN79984.1 hypothetical protein CG716_11035 [Mycolicibacterium sphagni]